MSRVIALIAAALAAAPLSVAALECPEFVGRWPYVSTVAVAIADGHAYFGGEAALFVAEMTDPEAPRFLSHAELASDPEDVVRAVDVAIAGGHAYIAALFGGLRVVDVSDPANPAVVAVHPTPGQASGVAVAGNYAYIANGYGGLRVVDVSAPRFPVEVGSVDTPGPAGDVAVVGTFAYVVDGGCG